MNSKKPWTHNSLKAIFPHFEANLRFKLAQRCPSLSTVERHATLRIDHLHFQEMKTTINDTTYQLGLIRRYPNGVEIPQQIQDENEAGGVIHDIDRYGCREAEYNNVSPGDIKIAQDSDESPTDFEKEEKKILRRMEESPAQVPDRLAYLAYISILNRQQEVGRQRTIVRIQRMERLERRMNDFERVLEQQLERAFEAPVPEDGRGAEEGAGPVLDPQNVQDGPGDQERLEGLDHLAPFRGQIPQEGAQEGLEIQIAHGGVQEGPEGPDQPGPAPRIRGRPGAALVHRVQRQFDGLPPILDARIQISIAPPPGAFHQHRREFEIHAAPPLDGAAMQAGLAQVQGAINAMANFLNAPIPENDPQQALLELAAQPHRVIPHLPPRRGRQQTQEEIDDDEFRRAKRARMTEDIDNCMKNIRYQELPVFYKRESTKLPYEILIQLTISSPRGKTIEHYKYDRKLFQAMKSLHQRLLGGRPRPIEVGKLEVNKEMTLKLPERLKLKISEMKSLVDFEVLHKCLSPIIDPASYPLQVLDTNGRFQPEHEVVRTAHKLLIRDRYQLVDWLPKMKKLQNRIVYDVLDYPGGRTQDLIGLIDNWLEDGREVGTCFTFGVEYRRKIQVLMRRLIEMDIADTTENSITLPMNNNRAIVFSHQANPDYVAGFGPNTQERWIAKMEVVHGQW